MGLTPASVDRVKRAHQHVNAEAARAIDDALSFAGRFAVQYVHDHPEFRPRTGALQRATKARVVRTKGGKVLKLSNPKAYAGAIDKGAKAHPIAGKNGGLLRFRGRNGWVSKRQVQHPGNRPYKFLYRAHRAAYRVLGTNLTQRLTAIARRF